MSNNADESFDDRYVRFREHADVRERVTALEGNQTQVLNVLSRIETTLNARPPVTPAPDNTSLAMHHLADAVKKLGDRPNITAEVMHAINTSKAGRGGSAWPWAIVGACVALVVFMGLRQFTG